MQRPSSDSRAVASDRSETTRPLDVLLVSHDPRWTASVREAVAAEGGVVETVTARAAVARLASAGPHLSHVLVDQNDADGLLETLAELTSDTASPEVTLLVLGVAETENFGLQVIASADRQAVAASLAIRHFPSERNEPTLPTVELLEVVTGAMIETRYQPIVQIADRKTMAVEVLARLNHPTHGTVTPDWFVPRFEDAGLSFTLTDLVSTRALADLTGPGFAGLGLAMALNYPLKVLSHPEAAANLDERRASLGLTPEQVQIELTESRPVEDFAALGRSLDHLRALGYRISIDDVGPAVKNLDRLLTLPFTGLKLDKGIVQLIGTQGPGASMAPTVFEKALARGLTVVAEGVETQEMWDRLRALGVHEAQGYFIARPLPTAAVSVWLEAWRAKQST
ncbi:MAG: EAL domain-containing protein [Acetobacteraceae bacterium]|jgi:EAL domain-containing protein (putative c-di-GMP-specific phosphodiesterase class I)